MNANTDFRICPDSGFKIHRPAEALIKANAVLAVVFLLVGGVLGLLAGTYKPLQPQPDYAAFVERCLKEKGYETTGWQ